MPEFTSKKQILHRLREIEKELIELLEETESDFTLDDIKEIIYNEEDHDDLMDVIAMFDEGQGPGEFQNILDLANDAWNYFPHKTLGDRSPAEMIFEYQKQQKNKF
jgi:hypothetical protein